MLRLYRVRTNKETGEKTKTPTSYVAYAIKTQSKLMRFMIDHAERMYLRQSEWDIIYDRELSYPYFIFDRTNGDRYEIHED